MAKWLESTRNHVSATASEARRQAEWQKRVRVDLPAADQKLGERAWDLSYSPDGSEALIESLVEIEISLRSFDDRPPPDPEEAKTWKHRAGKAVEGTKDAVEFQRLKQQRKALWKKLGTLIREDSTEPSLPELNALRAKGLALVADIQALEGAEDRQRSPLVKGLFLVFVLTVLIGGGAFAYRAVTGNRASDVAGGGRGTIEDSGVAHGAVAESKTHQDSGRTLSPVRPPKLKAPRQPDPIAPLPSRPQLAFDGDSEKWVGVYFVYPRYIGIELILQEVEEPYLDDEANARRRRSDGMPELTLKHVTSARVGLKGTAKFFSLRSPDDRNAAEQELGTEFGSCEVVGWRDPSLDTFYLRTSRWIDVRGTYNSRTLITLRGVHSASLGRLGGWALDDQYFVAASQPEDQKNLWERASRAHGSRDPGFRRYNPEQLQERLDVIDQRGYSPEEAQAHKQAIIDNVTDKGRHKPYWRPSEEELDRGLQWFDYFVENVPLRERESWKMGDHHEKAMSLYLSDRVTEIFGKPFENLSDEEREDWEGVFRDSRRGKYGAEAEKRSWNFTGVNMFKGGSPGWPGTVAAIWTHRVLRAWSRETLQRFDREATHAESFGDFLVFRSLATAFHASYFEHERQDFALALPPVEKALAVTTLSRLDRPRELDRERRSTLIDAAGSAAAEPHLERLRQIENGLLVEDLRTKFNEVVAVPDNIEALFATADWLKDFRYEFRFLRAGEVEAYEQVEAYLAKRRARLLDAFEEDIVGRMANAQTAEEVERLWRACLIDEQETTSRPGKVIAEAAEVHIERARLEEQRARAKAEREAQLAFYSEQEKGWMQGESLQIHLPETIPPPTAESIRHAFCREMGYLPGSKRLAPGRVSYSWPGFGSLVSIELTIKAVDLERVESLKNSADGDYRCHYYIDMTMTQKGDIVDSLAGSVQGDLLGFLEALGEAESKVTRITDHFYLTRDGWRSRTLKGRGIESLFRGPGG